MPKLLKLQREQQLDTFRASAKPPPDAYRTSDELRDCSEDEIGRLKVDEGPLKRKGFSFAGFPVLAQQKFSSLRKSQTVQSSIVSKDSHELSTSKKQLRRKDTASLLTSAVENMREADRVRKTDMFKMVSKENAD